MSLHITFLPLVSLSPHDFHDSARDADRIEADDWPAYWRASLAESGIDELVLSPLAFSCVDARTLIRPSTISRLVTAYAPELNAWMNDGAHGPVGAVLDQTPTLGGGIALLLDGEPFVEPGCCSSLDDLAEWDALLELSASSDPLDLPAPSAPFVASATSSRLAPPGVAERTVWAGHDLWSPHARLDADGSITLRRVGDGYNRGAVVETVQLDRTSLAGAIATTRGALVELALRIADVLTARIDARKARRIASHLAGLDESLLSLAHDEPGE